jgi:hypothetical protein
MQRRIALKRLTASDLTLFGWQFKNRPAGNQKSINLNADVFIDLLFPSLPEAAVALNGRIPLDLYIYGPGHGKAYNLQRKILKGTTYKNWRLDGEYINNPEDDLDRFNVLEPGDIGIFEFQGVLVPTSAKLILIAQRSPPDMMIHAELSALLGTRSMVHLPVAQLDMIAERVADAAHPLHLLTIDAELEDAALGGSRGLVALRRKARPLSQDELQRARQIAADVGREGEELVCAYLTKRQFEGSIVSFVWASDTNAITPYDFLITLPDETEIALDVKSTNGKFERPLHISTAELLEMANRVRYDIYRVSEISASGCNLRVAQNVGPSAEAILRGFAQLPRGVEVDSVSIDVSVLEFGEMLKLSFDHDQG